MKKNKRKHTPIAGLADHVLFFNAKARKGEISERRVSRGDRFYTVSNLREERNKR